MTFRNMIESQEKSLDKVIKFIKTLKDIEYFRGNYKNNNKTYNLDLYMKDDTHHLIIFNKNDVIIDGTKIIQGSHFIKIVEFAKEFSKLTNDNEDYYIMMDVLTTIYNSNK